MIEPEKQTKGKSKVFTQAKEKMIPWIMNGVRIGVGLFMCACIWFILLSFKEGTQRNTERTQVDVLKITGQKYIALEEIQNKVQRTNLSEINLKEVQESIQSLPWVAQTKVMRLWPNQIEIDIQERTPIALWNTEGKEYIVDDQGSIIKEYKGEEGGWLRLLGKGAPQKITSLQEILREYPSLEKKIQSAEYISKRRWDITVKEGEEEIRVKLPAKEIKEAIDELRVLDEEKRIFQKDINYIDLRLKDRIIMGKE